MKPLIELDIWQLLVGFVAAMGIPSAIMGLIVKRLEKRLAKRDSLRDEQDRSQKDLIVLLVQSTNASISLGEATGRGDGAGGAAHPGRALQRGYARGAGICHQRQAQTKGFFNKTGRRCSVGLGERNGKRNEHDTKEHPEPIEPERVQALSDRLAHRGRDL